jgi:hypothetical protein
MMTSSVISQASRIVSNQKPPSGAYPHGEYYSSKHVNHAFFDEKTKEIREKDYAKIYTPFLFQLIYKKLVNKPTQKDPDDADTLDQLKQSGSQWER